MSDVDVERKCVLPDEELMEARPWLRADTAFLPVSEGVLLRNNTTSLVVKGKNAHQWLSALAPTLTGEHSIELLCRPLGETQRAAVIQLLETLLANGFAWDARLEGSLDPALDEPIRQRFAAQINFIAHHTDQAQHRFARFRESRVLAVGSGPLLGALVDALARNGLASITVATDDLVRRDDMIVDQRDVPAVSELEHLGVHAFDAVVYCDDPSEPEVIRALSRLCLGAGVRFLPLTVLGRTAVLGPSSSGTGPCWFCLVVRYTTNAEPGTCLDTWLRMSGLPAAGDAAAVTPAAAALLGTGLAFTLFNELVGGMTNDHAGEVVLQDTQTLITRRTTLLQHPDCPDCRPALPAFERDEPLSGQDLEHSLGMLSDPEVGLFTGYADDTLDQMPLKVAALSGRAVPGLRAPKGSRRLVAFGLDSVLEARLDLLHEAVRRCSMSFPNRRDIVFASADDLTARDQAFVPGSRLVTWTGLADPAPDAPICWLTAVSVFTGEQVLVPAAAVHPATTLDRELWFEPSPAGSAAATTVDGVAEAGTLSVLEYVRLREVVRHEARVRVLRREKLAGADPRLEFLLSCLGRYRIEPTVLETIGANDAHVIIAVDCAGRHVVGSGLSGVQAAIIALRDLLGHHQLARTAPGIDVVTRERTVTDFTPTADMALGRSGDSRFLAAPTTFDRLRRQLRKAGHGLLRVDATAVDIASTATLVSGRMLLYLPDQA